MRAGIALSWIAVASLAVACADDQLAISTASSTTDALPGSTGVSGSGGVPTSAGTSDAGSTGSTDSGDASTSGTSSPVTSTSATSTPATTSAGESSGDEGSSSTGDQPLPGCGDTPPEDFDAKPSAPARAPSRRWPATSLEVTISGEILADATADFHLREVQTLTADDDFTIVVLPDTQNYTQFPGNFPQYPAQTKWIWDHRNTDRIVAVLHNGDVVQHGNQIEVEWERAEQAMSTLENTGTQFPDGIPYSIAVGNHDNGAHAHNDEPFSTAFFNKYFGVSRFKDRAYYGGHYGKKNDNSWIEVNVGSLEIVMLSLEYRGELGQDPDVLAWAKGVFEDHPNALGIVNSHHIVKANGDFGAEGKQIYAVMKTVDNVQLMTSGHIKAIRARRTDVHKGRTIHSMLADYQDLIIQADDCAGGCGYMRIWRFSPVKNQLKVETYSPSLNKSMTGPKEQFTLTVDLSAATGSFALAGSTKGPGEVLAFTAEGLKTGATYEWYAVVKECGAKVTTPKRKFTVN